MEGAVDVGRPNWLTKAVLIEEILLPESNRMVCVE